MTLRVGMKVVQFKPWPSNDTAYADVSFTRMGVAYTVREVLTVRGITALRFVELRNPEHRYAGFAHPVEQPFPAALFRPVVERKTDISVFTAMLNPSQVTVDAMNTADFARESAG